MRIGYIIAALLVIVIFTTSPVAAQETPDIKVLRQPDGSLIVHINAAMVKKCDAEGGCGAVAL